MLQRSLAEVEERLRRDPGDREAWLDLARLAARTGAHPTVLRQQHLDRLLALWEEVPEARELARLVLPLLSLEPAPEGPPPAWWREHDRVAASAEGPYDRVTGLPLAALHQKTGKEMVWIPPGRFSMGGLAYLDQGPLHPVQVSGYWISRFPVTVEEFAAYAEATEAEVPLEWASQLEEPERPVTWVRWEAARDWCRWAGGRLPTEAEWEYAARGGDGRLYPWGDALPHPSWVNVNPEGRKPGDWDRWLEEVGSRPSDSSPFGVRDLGGNARDWVGDWYGGGYYREAPLQNPPGPAKGSLRVVRGGSWFVGEQVSQLRASQRWSQAPASVDGATGFRLVCDLGGGEPA